MHIDWWSGTTQVEGKEEQRSVAMQLMRWLEGDWRAGKGRHAYSESYLHESGAAILYDGMDGMGVHLSLPSGALAHWAADVEQVFVGYDWRCSRLDIAADIQGMTVGDLGDDLACIINRSSERRMMKDLKTGATTIYLGSQRGGDRLIRIYDKGRQLAEPVERMRVELQLRGKQAAAAWAFVAVGGRLADIIGQAIDFRAVGRKRVTDRPRLDWWQAAVGEGKSGFRFPRGRGDTPSLERKLEWIDRQVAGVLAQCHHAMGDGWLRGELAHGAMRSSLEFYGDKSAILSPDAEGNAA